MTWYFTITNEMRELGLKGNELLVYAVISGYSSNGQGCYYGGVAYLSQLCDINPRSVIRILKKLQERGLIEKEEVRARGVHRVSFFVNRGDADVTSKDDLEVTKCAFRSDILYNAPINNKIDNINITPVVDKSTTPPTGVSRSKANPILQKFLAYGVNENDLRDWKTARKGAAITDAVFNGMKREADKAGITLAEAVRICAENSWRGFRAEYLDKKGGRNNDSTGTFMGDINRTYAKLQERWAARMEGYEQ